MERGRQVEGGGGRGREREREETESGSNVDVVRFSEDTAVGAAMC